MMKFAPRPIAAGLGLALLASLPAHGALAQGAPAQGAVPLMPHKATYRLVLDGSRPTGQLEDMRGQIDYEITGDACAGFSTVTRQTSQSTTGDGTTLSQEVVSKAWEDGEAKSYRFVSTTQSSTEGSSEVEANVTREGDDLKVMVTKPRGETLSLGTAVLMPTEHVKKVIAAGAAGTRVVQAKVYDGASDPGRVYETLTVVGRAASDPARAPDAAKAALAGRTYYPVTVSYYEPGKTDGSPAYVMTFALYDNGVVGDLKIDYGRFALLGSMASFEPLKAAEGCAK